MLANETINDSFTRLAIDRRLDRRLSDEVSFQTSYSGENFVDAPVVECSDRGARVVLSDFPQPGDALHIVVGNPLRTRRGMARIAWVNPLSHGRAVVGLEFRNFA